MDEWKECFFCECSQYDFILFQAPFSAFYDHMQFDYEEVTGAAAYICIECLSDFFENELQ